MPKKKKRVLNLTVGLVPFIFERENTSISKIYFDSFFRLAENITIDANFYMIFSH